MYREVDSTLDWGTGEAFHLIDYLQYIENQIPEDPDEAEEYLLDLQRNEFLMSNHVTYLYQTHVQE